MVLGLGKGKKKKEEEERRQARRDTAHIEQQVPLSEDEIYSIGKAYFSVEDPKVKSIIDKYECLQPFHIIFSPVNRLTKMGSRGAELDELDQEGSILVTKMNMDEDKYDGELWGILDAFKPYGRNVIRDGFNGHKAKMWTEQIRVIRTEENVPEKKRLPF